MIKISAIN